MFSYLVQLIKCSKFKKTGYLRKEEVSIPMGIIYYILIKRLVFIFFFLFFRKCVKKLVKNILRSQILKGKIIKLFFLTTSNYF